MIAMDAGVLSLMIYGQSAVPKDFKTGLDIEHARERIDALIKKLDGEAESIVIATPALSEALVVVAPDIQRHVTAIESQSCFKIRAFDKRAAIEIALRVKRSKEAGDKKEGVGAAWDKIKYDHQIVAVAKPSVTFISPAHSLRVCSLSHSSVPNFFKSGVSPALTR